MNNNKLAVITLLSLGVLYTIHTFGISNHLYLTVWYYDIIAHLVGGICLALSSLYVLKSTKHIVLITFVLGVIWELYEVYFDLTGHPFGSLEYNLDTIKDLLIDTLGACTVWYIAKNKK